MNTIRLTLSDNAASVGARLPELDASNESPIKKSRFEVGRKYKCVINNLMLGVIRTNGLGRMEV